MDIKCPITNFIFKEPVLAADGMFYERSAIEKWFFMYHNKSPITGKVIDPTLYTCFDFNNYIEQYLVENPKKIKNQFISSKFYDYMMNKDKVNNFIKNNQFSELLKYTNFCLQYMATTQFGFYASYRTYYNNMFLHLVINCDSFDIIKHVIDNTNDINMFDFSGRSYIHYACDRTIHSNSRKTELIKYLVEKGADLNTGRETTPLSIGISNNDIETIELLLESGANPNHQDYNGFTLLHHLCSEHRVYDNIIDAIKLIIKYGANVKQQSVGGDHPIHLACYRNDLDVMKCLVENGADLECENNNRLRPIHYACMNGNKHIIRYLIESNVFLDFKKLYDSKHYPLSPSRYNLSTLISTNKYLSFNQRLKLKRYILEKIEGPENKVVTHQMTKKTRRESNKQRKAISKDIIYQKNASRYNKNNTINRANKIGRR